MTLQEIFDKVILHLRRQHVVSVCVFGACAYRGDEGRQCAIGCLIPDDEYDPNMEGNNVQLLTNCPTLVALLLQGEDWGMLLDALKSLHDDTMDIEGIFGTATRVAAVGIAQHFYLNQEALHAPLQ